VGLLPCPVRLPLMEVWNAFLKDRESSGETPVNHELKAASMGLEWVQENLEGIEDPDALPDLFISAGFDMFFDKEKIGRFRAGGVFADLTRGRDINRDFKDLDLNDPEGRYSIIAVVPAVFLVNTAELGDRPVPKTWEDILSPVFENSVSLPVGDFDLFNGILLNIHKKYGDEGVRALGRSLLESMHPSQMVRSDRRREGKPAVTIMPYFFTKMVKEGSSLQAVWPEDGAIISPIFMLAKNSERVRLQPIVDFFASEETGRILSGQGLFPSTHPEVSNNLKAGSPFMWLGWDYIAARDLSQLIRHCEHLFHGSAGENGMEAAS
jgi:ABC-type Fe3+ transport system substrate-binding protein